MTTQEQLLLLRLCFAPRLNHLIRTLHPEVVREGCRAFDKALMVALERTTGCPLLEHSVTMAQLPIRMGGLGLFSQEVLSPFAFGASFALSRQVLLDRNLGSLLSSLPPEGVAIIAAKKIPKFLEAICYMVPEF